MYKNITDKIIQFFGPAANHTYSQKFLGDTKNRQRLWSQLFHLVDYSNLQ